MNEEARRRYEEELKIDEERLRKEINDNPDMYDVTLPEKSYKKVWDGIRENEAKEAEEKELIRLGRIYRRKRKNRKYLILAAVMVFVLALGITSVGGPEKVFERVTWMLAEREQTNIDSDSECIKPLTGVDEEGVYEEIEEKFGFLPVRLNHLPAEIEYQGSTIGDKIQGVSLIYGHDDKADIAYIIRPNYRESSLGTDMEDTKIQEYQLMVNGIEVQIKRYRIEETEENKWSVEFLYQDVQYFLRILGMEQEEVEETLNNLYFP